MNVDHEEDVVVKGEDAGEEFDTKDKISGICVNYANDGKYIKKEEEIHFYDLPEWKE